MVRWQVLRGCLSLCDVGDHWCSLWGSGNDAVSVLSALLHLPAGRLSHGRFALINHLQERWLNSELVAVSEFAKVRDFSESIYSPNLNMVYVFWSTGVIILIGAEVVPLLTTGCLLKSSPMPLSWPSRLRITLLSGTTRCLGSCGTVPALVVGSAISLTSPGYA